MSNNRAVLTKIKQISVTVQVNDIFGCLGLNFLKSSKNKLGSKGLCTPIQMKAMSTSLCNLFCSSKSSRVVLKSLTALAVFPVVLCTIYRSVLTFESKDEILNCDHLNESY